MYLQFTGSEREQALKNRDNSVPRNPLGKVLSHPANFGKGHSPSLPP